MSHVYSNNHTLGQTLQSAEAAGVVSFRGHDSLCGQYYAINVGLNLLFFVRRLGGGSTRFGYPLVGLWL